MPQRPSPSAHSALWAAWGDALGFPVELVRSPRELRRRIGADRVELPPAWRRRVGGRNGVEIPLPAGAYSDDTQLRLAVARCLRANGRFDVEAFSKIELPVFLSYELGAGRATRAAAHSLMRRSVHWHSNFFARGDVAYVKGGGNGAAMRIQPHVWAAPDHRADAYLPGLLRDAITTHGHPRGILGAAWHALALGTALRDREIPAPDVWQTMAGTLAHLTTRMAADEAVRDRWLPQWELSAGRSFEAAVAETAHECLELAALAARAAGHSGPLEDRYRELVRELGGMRAETRGSGTISAALALWLAWNAADDPARGLRAAANLHGSDTDTVATMAGALLGAVVDAEPPGEIQDRDLHIDAAHRLDRLRDGAQVEDFPHPDPLGWEPPRTLSDAVGTLNGSYAVYGLGPCRPQGDPVGSSTNDDLAWQWLETSFGQNLLIKRRPSLSPLPAGALPRARRTRRQTGRPASAPIQPPDASNAEISVEARQANLPDRVEDAVALVVEGAFDELTIGRLILHLGRQPEGERRAATFVARVVQASNGPLEPPDLGDPGRGPATDGQLALIQSRD